MPITLYQYLNEQVQAVSTTPCFCYFNQALKEYMNLSRLLLAAGHDTDNLDHAIETMQASIVNLREATRDAQTTFAQQGIKEIESIEREKDCLQ